MNIIETIKKHVKIDPKTALNVTLAIGAGVFAAVDSLQKQKEKAELDKLKKFVSDLEEKQ